MKPLSLRPLVAIAVMALASVAGHAQAPAATAPVDQALIQRFANTTTDDARVALLREHPVLADEASREALLRLGGDLARRRELTAAEGAYRSLLWLGDATRNSGVRARALNGLGSVEGQRGNLLRALTLLEEALAIGQSVGDAQILQPIHSVLGVVQRRLGDYEKATTSFDRSLALAQELNRDPMKASVYNNIGAMHLSRGRLDLALEYFTRSLDLKKDDGGRGTIDMATSLNNIGAVYEELGDYERALPYFQRARDLVEKVGARAAAMTALGNIGHARAALGQIDLAREALQEALALAEAAGDGNGAASILQNLGNLARDDGDLKSAEAFHRRSLALREAGGDAAGLAESHAELAAILMNQGRLQDAEAQAVRAVSIAGPAGQLGHLARGQLYLGQVYERQGRLDHALATFEAGVTTVEALREVTPPGERARQVFLATRLGPYYAVAAIHAKAGRGLEGLMAVERARARTLLDILAAGRPPRRELTEEERTREQQLAAAALAASVGVIEAQKAQSDPAVIKGLQEGLRVARQDREAFTTALYASRPELRIVRGDAPVISSQQLTAVLPQGTAALEFVVEPDRAWGYFAKAGPDGVAVTVRRLPLSAGALQALAARFSTQVGRRDLGFAASSTELYAALLGEFDPLLTGVSHLIVVPDATLWRVPFQALQSPRGRFLIEERAVSYAPSLSALAALHERRASRSNPETFMLALGDPATVAAGRLPEAAREVQALARLYGADRSAVFVDAAATEASFRQAVRHASVVHIATHGVLDDNNPMYSHLKLAADTGADTNSDGRLEAWEMLDLDLNADIAVLSACQTASGAIGGGEGVVGLSWALFAAGASTAVVSQWEVDSASTTVLMIGLHERLLVSREGSASAPDALRGSAIALMKDPRYRHPFYWAGFIVIGAR